MSGINDVTMIQLTGHLKGQALEEWELIEDSEKQGWYEVVKVLQSQLEHGQHAMVAQDFQYLHQWATESVGDFIRRLARAFKIGYGKS